MAYSYDFHPTSRKQTYVEYVEEATYGTAPTNPTMNWFGGITNFDDQSKIKTDTKSVLADSTITDRTMFFRNSKFGEEVGLNIDFEPQSSNLLTTMTYALGGDATHLTTVDDSLKSITVAAVDAAPTDWHNPAYSATLYTGLVCEEYTLSVPEENAASVKSKWVGTGRTFGPTTYIGTGSHAEDVGSAVLSRDQLSNVYIRTSKDTPTAWGSATKFTDAVNELELKITNKIGLPKDFNTATTTKIKAAVLLSRRLTLSLGLTYADLTGGAETDAITFKNIYDFTPYDIQFTFDTKVYTLSGVRFPELPYKAGAEDLVGDKLTSMPISGIYEDDTWCPPLVIT